MRITIDTKEDSAEDIKRLISMLNHLVGNKVKESSIMPEQAPSMMNMFSDNDTGMNSSDISKKEEKKEHVQITMY